MRLCVIYDHLDGHEAPLLWKIACSLETLRSVHDLFITKYDSPDKKSKHQRAIFTKWLI